MLFSIIFWDSLILKFNNNNNSNNSNNNNNNNDLIIIVIITNNNESYASTIAWIRTRVSFVISRSALVCLRGSRSRGRTNLQATDLEVSRMTD